jgi:hypothetical protein
MRPAPGAVKTCRWFFDGIKTTETRSIRNPTAMSGQNMSGSFAPSETVKNFFGGWGAILSDSSFPLLPENSRVSQLPLQGRHFVFRHLLGLPFRKALHREAAHAKDFLQGNPAILAQPRPD